MFFNGCARHRAGAEVRNILNYSALTNRIAGEQADAWKIHDAACAAQLRGEDVILLSIGDPDMDSPAPVLDAAQAALEGGDTHYSPIAGYPALRAAVADYHGRRFGRPLQAAEVAICAGTQHALFVGARCLLDPGDEVLVPDPAYVTYQATLEADGARVIAVPTQAEEGFRLDPARLEVALSPASKAIFLANPNNPSGAVIGPDALGQLVEFAVRHDLWLVVDEVYMSLVYGAAFHSVLEFPEAAERIVVLGSLSKSHAMTGWRVGWVIGPQALIAHIARLNLITNYGLPGFVQQGALAALQAYDALAAPMAREWQARRDLAVQLLSDCPGLGIVPPQAGMFMLLDGRGSGLSSRDLSWRLLREGGVALLDAGAFGAATQGFLRLSFAASEAKLREACRRIRLVMESVR